MTAALTHLSAALLHSYRVEREIGAGGMATVYLARDLKHDRDVAIKVLHPELGVALGGDRFLSEIKTTAKLQHPHILPLLDSGNANGMLYYVMPLVTGETLRARLEREKQLPIDDALRIAREVADALGSAHALGIIHRDIKPENILLQGGHALVADFGIALALQSAGSARMTQTGLSLGTPQYMSPEQSMGERTVDARCDVYALGVVTYEMLTGEPPFTGPTAQAIVAKAMTERPAVLTTVRDTITPAVEYAVLKALAKLPADRFASAAEFSAALTNPAFVGTVSRVPTRRRALVLAGLPWVLAVGALSYIAFDNFSTKSDAVPSIVQRFSIKLPENAEWIDESGSGMALSPDGTMLVYAGRDSSGQRRMYLRPMDQLAPRVVTGGESGGRPFFSHDGRWLGFVAQGIQKILVSGGAPEFVCKIPGYVNATWLESDMIVFGDGSGIGLQQCAPSGVVTTLLASDSGETFNFPHGLPGDRGLLFSVRRGGVQRLAVFDMRTKTKSVLEINGTDPRYVATGHVVYTSPDGVVRAAPFDLQTLASNGEPFVIAEGVLIGQSEGALMGVSRSGIVVTAGHASLDRSLELVDRTGNGVRMYPQLGNYLEPRISPDGSRIAVALEGEIWLLDRTQGALTRLTHDSLSIRPVWSSDGRQLAYVRQVGAKVDLRIVPADGSAPATSLLTWSDYSLWQVAFTPHDASIVVRTTGGPLNREIWLVLLDSTRERKALLPSPADEVAPAVSPDGHWLAYSSNESGRYEVYVRPFPGMGARYTVSLDGGTEPVWSRRGNELFYRTGPKLQVAEVRLTPAFDVVRRMLLFANAAFEADPTHQNYDVTPDGAHFVMVRSLGGHGLFTVTLHQFENPQLPAAGGVRR